MIGVAIGDMLILLPIYFSLFFLHNTSIFVFLTIRCLDWDLNLLSFGLESSVRIHSATKATSNCCTTTFLGSFIDFLPTLVLNIIIKFFNKF